MATENTNKKVTLDQMKKALARSKSETEKAISASGGGEVATDAEVDAMLNEVFGSDASTPSESNPTENTPSDGNGDEA